jgi:hypothetical protein
VNNINIIFDIYAVEPGNHPVLYTEPAYFGEAGSIGELAFSLLYCELEEVKDWIVDPKAVHITTGEAWAELIRNINAALFIWDMRAVAFLDHLGRTRIWVQGEIG